MEKFKNKYTITESDDEALILEAAYLSGFEPSCDNIARTKEINEAVNFLITPNYE